MNVRDILVGRSRLAWAAIAAIGAVVGGLVALVLSGNMPSYVPGLGRLLYWVAAVLAIYPGSAVFLIVPKAALEILPNWSLFPIGVLSAWLVWVLVFYVAARSVGRRMAQRGTDEHGARKA